MQKRTRDWLKLWAGAVALFAVSILSVVVLVWTTDRVDPPPWAVGVGFAVAMLGWLTWWVTHIDDTNDLYAEPECVEAKEQCKTCG